MASREINILIKAKNLASGAIKQVNGELAGIGKHAQRGMGNAARNIERGVFAAGAAAVGGLAYAVKTAASFEQAFTGVEKTVEATDAQFKELENTIRGMARAGLGTFEELAGIGEAGGALGIARESLDEFIDVVARLSKSTDLTAEAAATSLGQLSNVLHLGEGDLEDFADTLVALGNAGASTESQIVEMAARFGAAGNSAGLSKEEILALSSAVASMGIEVEAGGSSLSRLFNNVTTNIGTGSAKAAAFAEALGMTGDEFKRAWDGNALGTFEDLLAHLNTLDQFEAANLLKSIGITNVRDVNAIALMSQNVGFLSEQLGIAKDATGALDKESDKFLNTTEGRWFTLQQNVRDVANTIGTALLPVVNELIGEFTEWMSLDSTQAQIGQLAKDVAAGVRDAVTWAKSLDWNDIGNALKTAGQFGKTLLDAFLAMPPWVQTAVLTGWGLNKLTGGAVGSIAGTIAAGIGKAMLQKIGLMNVTAGVVNVNGKMGPGGPGGRTPGGRAPGRFPFAPVAGALALPLMMSGSDAPDAQQFADRKKVERGEMTQAEFDALWRHAVGSHLGTGGQAGGGRSVGGSFGGTQRDIGSGWEERFGDKLDVLATDDVLKQLGRTTEMGLAGVGTSVQVGITDGMDPIGDIATRILARAEDPKAPAVMAEIKGHLLGLEEIQATYLANGDIHLAEKVQTNIDTLHTLIGTADQFNAITHARGVADAASDAAMLGSAERTMATINAKGDQTIGKVGEVSGSVAAMHGTLSAKNFSPLVKVDPIINTSVFLALQTWQQTTVSSIRANSNSGGFI